MFFSKFLYFHCKFVWFWNFEGKLAISVSQNCKKKKRRKSLLTMGFFYLFSSNFLWCSQGGDHAKANWGNFLLLTNYERGKKNANPYTFIDTYFEPCLKILQHFRFFRVFFLDILATIFKKLIAFETNKSIQKFCKCEISPPKKHKLRLTLYRKKQFLTCLCYHLQIVKDFCG
jgi:hypothetical protein